MEGTEEGLKPSEILPDNSSDEFYGLTPYFEFSIFGTMLSNAIQSALEQKSTQDYLPQV